MLTASESELLTTAVDGELTPGQSQAFLRLLKAKPEATTLFCTLKADAESLRARVLPPIPVSQVAAVLGRIRPTMSPRRPAPTRRTLVLQYAVAASVFFTLCSASFWVFTARDRREQDKVQIRRLPVIDTTTATPERDSFAIAHSEPKLPEPKPPVLPDENPLPKEVIAQKPVEPETAPAPRSAIGDVVGSGIIENPKPLTEVRLRLPFLTDATEFDTADVQARLKLEFALDPAFRLDLFSKNSTAALEMLQAAAKQAGVGVTVDAKTQDLLNKKVPISVGFYLEGMTAPELGLFFGAIGKSLQSAAKPLPLASAHLVPVGATEYRDLKELLGVDLIPQRIGRPIGEPKPISADTLGKVTGAVKKTGEKSGVVVAYSPANARSNPAQSKEVKAFLDKRPERKPGTIPLLIVIR